MRVLSCPTDHSKIWRDSIARYWFFAFSDCKDQTRSQEYNKWYSDAHIPDVLEVPGMIQATRWEESWYPAV